MSEQDETVHVVTVGLHAKADKALASAAKLSRRNHTDTINRALVVYEHLLRLQAEGGKVVGIERDFKFVVDECGHMDIPVLKID